MSRPPPPIEEIYEPGFVAALFDEMSASYGITNYVSSFGFCERWRRQTVEGVTLQPGMVVVDLMSGMGECWGFIRRGLRGKGQIVALDLSTEMVRRARRYRERFRDVAIDLLQGDALRSGLTDAIADRVVACFGLKTFSLEQIAQLGCEVWRLLRPGGTFSFVEIAVPKPWLLRALYLFYLRYLIPIIGRLFLGNPDNYRLLSVYAEHFADGDAVIETFRRQGFTIATEDLFFGCARRIRGQKAA